MATGYSEKVFEWSFEKWDLVGRRIEEREQGRYDEEPEEQGISANDYVPIMLYAYPLRDEPTDEKIREVHKETALTVVRKKETREYYLALCGGGMDFSQDIALAYLIVEGYVPHELAPAVSTQEGLTQSGDDFRTVMKGCKKALENSKSQADYKLKDVEKALA